MTKTKQPNTKTKAVEKYSVWTGRKDIYLGDMTMDEVNERFEDWPLRINEERKTITIIGY